MEVITLGIGTPSSIPHLMTFGLDMPPPVDLRAEDATMWQMPLRATVWELPERNTIQRLEARNTVRPAEDQD